MPTLYLVATPIGNLGDVSQRAIETLCSVDFIAAEDTRVSAKLFHHFHIKKPVLSYHEHNAKGRGEEIVSRILKGESCAVVTDAGMPCISDPGEELVRLCAQNNIPVIVIPGPNAAISALAASGLPSGRFSFEGFLSVKKTSRITHLNEIRDDPRTLVFYEAPHKLLRTLNDMCEVFGDRRVTLARELTKIHEEIMRATLQEAAAYYTENAPRGEFVIVVEGKKPEDVPRISLGEAVQIMEKLVENGEKPAAAARQAAQVTGYKKNELYHHWHLTQ